MTLTYARLQYFRSYTDGSFEFDPTVNIIVGPNASGKTTILEAILVGLGGKSFKASDKEVIHTENSWARVDIGTTEETRVVKIKTENQKTTKTFEIDGKVYKRLPQERILPTVLFEPNNLLLFHGSPERRRTFLDDLIEQITPGYTTTLHHYKRVLAQRNALLKQATQSNNDQLFVWNLRLSELGGKIVVQRRKLLEKLNEHISNLYSEIAGVKTSIEFLYQTPISHQNYETGLLEALERHFNRDSTLGFTSYGPHREDFKAIIGGKDASEVASRGEVRTMVLVLKMLEAQFVESARHKRPLLLLDDVFSELDGRRRQALVSFLKPYQSLITTTDADVVIDHFTTKAKVLALDSKN